MESMEKIGWLKIIICHLIILVILIGCKTVDFYKIDVNVGKSVDKLYNQYLKKYGNATKLDSEGNFAFVWYYDKNKIYITKIIWKKKPIFREYDCETPLDIKNFKQGSNPPMSVEWRFESSLWDAKNDSLYCIFEYLDVDELITYGSDRPVLKELRDQLIKYHLRE